MTFDVEMKFLAMCPAVLDDIELFALTYSPFKLISKKFILELTKLMEVCSKSSEFIIQYQQPLIWSQEATAERSRHSQMPIEVLL